MGRPLRFHARDRAAWTAWLEDHHATIPEVFLVFHRKATGVPTIAYDEAVEEALCFGWIDGIKHKLDDERYTYRFTPRRAGSAWSAINRERAARLRAAGKLRPAGLAAIAAAQAAGSWEPVRREVSDEMPAELRAALRKARGAQAAFAKLAPGHRRLWQRWVQHGKQAETRVRRAAKAAALIATGKGDPRKV